MREEIESGMRNALERGDTLEQAIDSFINAGYNPVEVREAANNISLGASTIVNNQIRKENPVSSQAQASSTFAKDTNIFSQQQGSKQDQTTSQFTQTMPFRIQQPQQPQQPNLIQYPQTTQQIQQSPFVEKKSSGKTAMVIILIVILAVLLAGLASLFIFSDEIMAWLKPSSFWRIYG